MSLASWHAVLQSPTVCTSGCYWHYRSPIYFPWPVPPSLSDGRLCMCLSFFLIKNACNSSQCFELADVEVIFVVTGPYYLEREQYTFGMFSCILGGFSNENKTTVSWNREQLFFLCVVVRLFILMTFPFFSCFP